jgi:hypothetical protein
MWSISLLNDPVHTTGGNKDHQSRILHSCITHSTVSLERLLKSGDIGHWEAFQDGGRVARVALADFVARKFNGSNSNNASLLTSSNSQADGLSFELEPLDKHTTSASRSRRRSRSHASAITPFMMERTDVFIHQDKLHVYLRILACADPNEMSDSGLSNAEKAAELKDGKFNQEMEAAVGNVLISTFDAADVNTIAVAMDHISTAVLQERLRLHLTQVDAIAFVADKSILPRKNGANNAPMASPPAVPFQAPPDSPMNRTLTVEVGKLRRYLTGLPDPLVNGQHSETTATLTGLLIPRGVTLIVGGGYHGKSTILRCIAAGIYNKVPGDGREFCATVDDAVTVRAEDGRYVNNCNVSGFISNLPTLPGVTKALDTTQFSSGEASGSTSQAANVVEAMEMGCSAFLVDEDVSAANFMARDGRMRSLVMDESITPLLYRVNGLYQGRGISSIVVVGGVGDWLDVPDAVVLMEKYVCLDATAKARSISRQFSHGHVQYAGRGVVHRLPWDRGGTPIPRRPADSFAERFGLEKTAVSLLDGGTGLLLHPVEHANDDETDEEEEETFIDLSRCEQLMGKKPQLYGCGVCVLWLLEASRKHPELGMPDLLKKLDVAIDEEGLLSVVLGASTTNGLDESGTTWRLLVETMGCAYRPRRYEVGQALTRLRGIRFEQMPVEDDGAAAADAAAAAEVKRKKRELADLWAARREKTPVDRFA